MRVDHAELAQAGAEGIIVDVALARHQHLRGAFPGHLVQGRQLALASRVRGWQAVAPGRDVPQIQPRIAGAQGPRQRVLRRVVEDQQAQPPGEPQPPGLTLTERVPGESGRPQAGGLERDHARDRQQPARVVFACETLERAGQQQDRQPVVSRPGHRGADPVSAPSRPPGMRSPALSGLSGERLAAEISSGLTFSGW
jgi:hypothetical protein